VLDKGAQYGCPLKAFRFRKTLTRDTDNEFNSFRTQWWDASFVYGQSKAAVERARSKKGGKLLVNAKHPNTLPADEKAGINITGDNKNSWVGVALLQELFVKEHNAVAEEIAKKHPEYKNDDEKLFTMARLVISALVAKIHTVDWTVELLKTSTLKVGMLTNWFGLPVALGLPKALPLPPLFKLIEQKQSNNHGTPFCLTEEFVAVYRLHPLLPDELLIGPDKKSIPLKDLVGPKGDQALRASPERPVQFWDSVTRYPCGHLLLHNYPRAMRDVAPTTDDGVPLPEKDVVDLAALDLFRDRERGSKLRSCRMPA